jgi:hypothetical protein
MGKAALDGMEGLDLGTNVGLLGSDRVHPSRSTARGEEFRDLFQAKPSLLEKRYDRESLDCPILELAAEPCARDASDEPVALVIVKGGGG